MAQKCSLILYIVAVFLKWSDIHIFMTLVLVIYLPHDLWQKRKITKYEFSEGQKRYEKSNMVIGGCDVQLVWVLSGWASLQGRACYRPGPMSLFARSFMHLNDIFKN